MQPGGAQTRNRLNNLDLESLYKGRHNRLGGVVPVRVGADIVSEGRKNVT